MSHPFQSVPLRAPSRERLTDQTAAALRDYVVSNRLAPGTRLPAESELAASLGVSRNVLRQAVASLQVLGMLRVAQGSGTFVADVADTEVFEQMAAWMGSTPVTEREYLEVRAIWDRGIYELVMDRAKAADLDRLEELAAATGHHREPRRRRNPPPRIPRGAARGSPGNQFLVTLGTILHRFFWEFGYLQGAVRKPPAPRLLDSHQAIVDLLRSRDRAAIDWTIDQHLSPHLSTDDEAGMQRP